MLKNEEATKSKWKNVKKWIGDQMKVNECRKMKRRPNQSGWMLKNEKTTK